MYQRMRVRFYAAGTRRARRAVPVVVGRRCGSKRLSEYIGWSLRVCILVCLLKTGGGGLEANYFWCGWVVWVWTGPVNPSSIINATFLRAQIRQTKIFKATLLSA